MALSRPVIMYGAYMTLVKISFILPFVTFFLFKFLIIIQFL